MNETSDGEDYYRSGCDTPNTLNAANSGNGMIAGASSQPFMNSRASGPNDSCMYELAPHFNALSSKLVQSQNKRNTMTTTTTSNSSSVTNSYLASSTTTSSILESVMHTDTSNEDDFNLSDSSKPNRNVHCLKEKLRRLEIFSIIRVMYLLSL